MEKRVLLIGVGLIGGSVALSIKKEHEEVTIIGFDVKRDHCKLAKAMHVIDECAESLQAEAEQADLIILAVPVEEAEKFIDQFIHWELKENVIITDVGSTKEKIMRRAEPLIEKGIAFIGGHPMAGSHKTGVGSAKAHLFENAYYMLTVHPETKKEKVEELKEWLKGTKGNFLTLDASEHDLLTGIVSHFPHIVAASLVRQVESHANENELVSGLAAGGFRDITRIASSSPHMWRDIVKQNRKTLLSLLNEWMMEMEEVRHLVEKGDSEELFNYFAGAKAFRDSLPSGSKGAIRSFYDLYVDVPDRVGVISHVTTLLAIERISITNIRIIEAREDVLGVLRISFQTEDDRAKAKACLEENNYESYITM